MPTYEIVGGLGSRLTRTRGRVSRTVPRGPNRNRVSQVVPESPRQRTGDIRGFADRAPVSIAAAHRTSTDERIGHHLRVRGLQQARPGQTADHAVGCLAVRRHRVSVQASQWSSRPDRIVPWRFLRVSVCLAPVKPPFVSEIRQSTRRTQTVGDGCETLFP